jgi:acetyltransferase-like isoleucine patch superfamily enzyme
MRVLAFIRRWGLIGAFARTASLLWNQLFTWIYCKVLGVQHARHTLVMPGAKLRKGPGGRIALGERTIIHSGACLLAYGGTIVIGDRCSVNPGCILYGHGGLLVGDGVLIAAGTIVIPANHGIASNLPIRGQGLSTEGIKIGNDVWLGSGVRILDGSIIESGVVVAAGGVVPRKRLLSGRIYAGVPVREIGSRSDHSISSD